MAGSEPCLCRGGRDGGTLRGWGTRMGSSPRATPLVLLLLVVVLLPAAGCVTVAEHRKLERHVIDLQRQRGTGQAREQLADLAAQVDALSTRLRELDGRLGEVAQTAEKGLSEARRARQEAAGAALSSLETETGGAAGATGTPAGEGASADPSLTGATGATGSSAAAAVVTPVPGSDGDFVDDPSLSDEVRAYQQALAATRAQDYTVCIDRFRAFLQTYASSSRADDAAFWIGDCHYRQGEFKQAVVRFDDVVRNYPTGNRAPDALYRQGESLLKLGPTFHPAARRAFERVLKEYPDSARAVEATRQLELQGAG